MQGVTLNATALPSTTTLVNLLGPLVNWHTLVLDLPAVLIQAVLGIPGMCMSVRRLKIGGQFDAAARIMIPDMEVIELVWSCSGLFAEFERPQVLDRLEALTVEKGASIMSFGATLDA